MQKFVWQTKNKILLKVMAGVGEFNQVFLKNLFYLKMRNNWKNKIQNLHSCKIRIDEAVKKSNIKGNGQNAKL